MSGKEGFHVLFNLAADSMFILDPGGFIREINQTAHARLGYTRAEMLGKHIGEFILPECTDMLVGRIAKAQSQEFLIYESAQVHKDGTILPIEVCSRAIVLEGKKLLFNIVRDIGERKRLDSKLRESEARFRALAADAPEAILIQDLDSDLFIDATSSAERLFACSREELFAPRPETFLRARPARRFTPG